MTEKHIVEYDDRYFAHCNYTRQQLYDLQNQILSIITKNSSDIEKDLDSKIDHKEIDLILKNYYKKKLIDRERLEVVDEIPIYKYYTKNNE